MPLEIAEIGARVAALAVRVAEDGNPNLRGDAVTGAVLAAASARSAACLVDINVRLGGLDPELSRRAARAVAEAGAAADRVMSTERAAQERRSWTSLSRAGPVHRSRTAPAGRIASRAGTGS